MKPLFHTLALAATVLLASTSFAQLPPPEKAAAKAERRVQGSESARAFVPGEGDPKPAVRAKVDRAARIAAREARKPAQIEAARTFKPGEGDPKPAASAGLSRAGASAEQKAEQKAERKAERKANRGEVARLNKGGQLPSYGDGDAAK